MRTCKEVMTSDPVCCRPQDNAVLAAKLMKKENIGSVPVCEENPDKRLLGIITDRDLAIQVVAEGRDPKTVKVQEVMTGQPFTCKADDDVQKALDAMEMHQIRRIPVVDSSDRLIGIIAQADVATRLKDPQKLADVVEEVSRPSTMRAG